MIASGILLFPVSNRGKNESTLKSSEILEKTGKKVKNHRFKTDARNISTLRTSQENRSFHQYPG